MNNEYIIVNKTLLEKRIEELEKAQKENPLTEAIWAFAKQELKQILSQSTSLIPEIEKAYENGFGYYSELLWDIEKGYGDKRTVKGLNKQDYISNLKLDI